MEVIKAMKGNMEAIFSLRAWEIGNPEKHGWIKIGVKSAAVDVDSEKIEIVEITDDSLYPTDDEMKAELTVLGVKFSKNIGTVKLKARYDDNKK